jgi:divalent metal cation (Fe/Co/Zn/Cd) transporter
MQEKKSGAKTLLWSVIMSSPGPLVVGLGLMAGSSSTQIADFVRRSAELLAIIVSFVVYTLLAKDTLRSNAGRQKLKSRSNVFVGAMMCLAGTIMAILAFAINQSDKGNVIPGLAIALLGVTANSIFWRKYTRLNRADPDAILAVQARLYRAKTLVDLSVTIALLSVLIAPQSVISYWLDFIGSLVVAVYLVWCGIRTIHEEKSARNPKCS